MKYFPFILGAVIFFSLYGCQKSIQEKHDQNMQNELNRLQAMS